MPPSSSSKRSSRFKPDVSGSKPGKRRRGPKHPGVTLIKPNEERRIWWRIRYADPDSGKTAWETLDATLTTEEARADYCARKSKAIARRRIELEGGALPTTGTGFSTAIGKFFTDHPNLRPATVEAYRAAANKLETWAERTGVKSADDLTGPKLIAFRATLVKEKKSVRKEGGKRGERKSTEIGRSPHSVNRELRSVGTVLAYVRKLGLLPRVTLEALHDGLEKLRVPAEPNEYLKPEELQRLLEAALSHDAAVFGATRAELSKGAQKGRTPRYGPVAPFVAALLLTGCRLNEAVDLTWTQVDLDAAGDDGAKVGEIRITAASKTHRGRLIDLTVSPALRKLLVALEAAGGSGSVFGLTEGQAVASALRLRNEYDAPAKFTWQILRSTAGSFLTCSPAIFAGASAYRSAKQLGHSVQIAERNYVGLIRGLSKEARDLETAMKIGPQMDRIIEAARLRPTRSGLAAHA